jgi:thiol:disulfide interchange protein DsbA
MNRGILIGSVLAVTALAATMSIRACAAPAPTAAATATATQWQPGLHYTVLGYPLPPSLPKGKVEVDEVFWYGCGHCYHLDPYLENWKKEKPAFVEFARIPVIWGPTQRQHAKLFYTLQKLGRADLHTKVFDAIHQGGKMLAAETDQQARALQLEFFKEQGVSEAQFNEAYDSAEVAQNVDLAERLTARYEVGSVPTMIVQGSYSTSVSQAGGEKQLLLLINDLAAREQRR